MKQWNFKSIPRKKSSVEVLSSNSPQLTQKLSSNDSPKQLLLSDEKDSIVENDNIDNISKQMSRTKDSRQKVINDQFKQNIDKQNLERTISQKQSSFSYLQQMSIQKKTSNEKIGVNNHLNNNKILKQDNLSRSSLDFNEFNSDHGYKKVLNKQKLDNYRPQFFNDNEWNDTPNQIQELDNKNNKEFNRLPKKIHTLILQKTQMSLERKDSNQKFFLQTKMNMHQKKNLLGQQVYQKNEDSENEKEGNNENTFEFNRDVHNSNNSQNIQSNQYLFSPKSNYEVGVQEYEQRLIQKDQTQQNYADGIKKNSLIKLYNAEAANNGYNAKQNYQIKNNEVQKNSDSNVNRYQFDPLNVERNNEQDQKDFKDKKESQGTINEMYNQSDRNLDYYYESISFKEKINLVRRWVFITFEDPSYSFVAKLICIFLQISIALSCAIFILNTAYLSDEREQLFTIKIGNDDNFNTSFQTSDEQTMNSSNTSSNNSTSSTIKDQINEMTTFQFNYAVFQMYVEFIVSILFITDITLRVLCCGSFGISVKKYLSKPINMIDAISITPFFVSLLCDFTHQKSLNVLRVIRLLRIVRIFKLSKYIKGMYILQKAILRSYKQLCFVLSLVLIIALFSSTIIFYVEKHLSQKDEGNDSITEKQKIESIPQALWFTLVTMMTIGYGDKLPLTIPGKTISICLAFLGNSLMIGLPIAIISHDFQTIYQEEREKDKLNSIKMQSISKFKKNTLLRKNTTGESNYLPTTVQSPEFSHTTGVLDGFNSNPFLPQNNQINSQNEINYQIQNNQTQFAQLPPHSLSIMQQQDISQKLSHQSPSIQIKHHSISSSPTGNPFQNQTTHFSVNIENISEQNIQLLPKSSIASKAGIQFKEEAVSNQNTLQSDTSDIKKLSFQINQKQNQKLQRSNLKKQSFHQTIQNENQNSLQQNNALKQVMKESGQEEQRKQTIIQFNDQDSTQNNHQIKFSRTSPEKSISLKAENKLSQKVENVTAKTQNIIYNYEDQDQTNNQDDIQEDHEYQAQIEYMANRLKQISKTNKIIRELTIHISKMSYIVTLDIAHLYHTFSQQKAQNNSKDSLHKNNKDIAYLASKCEKINSPLLKQRVKQIIAFQRSLHKLKQSSKISVDQFSQLNSQNNSRGNSLPSLNSYIDTPKKQSFEDKSIKDGQKPSLYFLQAQSQKKSVLDHSTENRNNNQFDNNSLPSQREIDQNMQNRKSFSVLKRSFSDINRFSNIQDAFISPSKENKNGTKQYFQSFFQNNNTYIDQENRIPAEQSFHSENLSDDQIKENTEYQKNNSNSKKYQDQSCYFFQNYQQNNLSHKMQKYMRNQQEPYRLVVDKKSNLLNSFDQNTPQFNPSKQKGLFNSNNMNYYYNQQISPTLKQNPLLIQDSIFKINPVQQNQYSEYKTHNSMEKSQFHNSINQQTYEILPFQQNLNESKLLLTSFNQGRVESIKSPPKPQKFKSFSKKSSGSNIQNSFYHNLSKSIMDSGIALDNTDSVQNLNPHFSKIRERNNFSIGWDDCSVQIEDDVSNAIGNLHNKENDYALMNFIQSQPIKKSNQKAKNIIEDLILNVSMDLQMQERNDNRKMSYLQDIELHPSNLLQVFNQERRLLKSAKSFQQETSQIIQEDFDKINKDIIQSKLKTQKSYSPSTPSAFFDFKMNNSKSSSNRKSLNQNQISFNKQQFYSIYAQNNNEQQLQIRNKSKSKYNSSSGTSGKK